MDTNSLFKALFLQKKDLFTSFILFIHSYWMTELNGMSKNDILDVLHLLFVQNIFNVKSLKREK